MVLGEREEGRLGSPRLLQYTVGCVDTHNECSVGDCAPVVGWVRAEKESKIPSANAKPPEDERTVVRENQTLYR